MEQVFRWGVQRVAQIHEFLLRLADRYSLSLTDKELHLLVMGILGMVLFFLTLAVFKMIEKGFAHSTMIFSFIFTFTNLIVVAFAIEIGQRISHTGNMEFLDIVYGLWGFIVMFTGFLLVLGTAHLIKKAVTAARR